MRCILVIFMTKYLLNRSGVLDVMTPEQSKAWFHLFVSAVYFTPIIGALLSDIWLGKYRTILYFSVLYCIGFFALAFDNTRLGLGIGLALSLSVPVVIKPCVSANVGDQFGQTNKHLIEKVYGWFYFAINFGVFRTTGLTLFWINMAKGSFGILVFNGAGRRPSGSGAKNSSTYHRRSGLYKEVFSGED
jgi:POT family proton-dependent oligopeptide transporter